MVSVEVKRELMPGDIYVAVHGRHLGLQVEIMKDRGHSVKVKVIGGGARSKRSMKGMIWTMPRPMFDERYVLEQEAKGINPAHTLEQALRNAMPEADVDAVVMPDPVEEAIAAIEAWPQPTKHRAPGAGFAAWTPEQRESHMANSLAKIEAMSAESKEEMRSLWETGAATLYEIAHVYHLSASALARWLGPRRRRDSSPDPGPEVQAPVPSAPDGHPIVIRKIEPPIIVHTPVRHSQETRSKMSEAARRQIQHQYEALSPETKAALVADRHAGMTYTDIMRKYHLANGAVTKVLHEDPSYLTKQEAYRIRRNGKAVILSTPQEGNMPYKATAAPVAPANSTTSYIVKMLVTQPVEVNVTLEATDFVAALTEAMNKPGVVKVVSVSEA